MSAIVPIPKIAINIRLATMDDLAFIDALQKKHTHMVGWMPTKQLEGKIGLGHVIIAEDDARQRLGYCIGNDQYFKRDDLGIIYQMNVVPEKRRSLVGATLVKAMFERSAYGCKLFCCWCAQDIEANRFWESLGFIPLAFRAGSRGKGRVHIFWQKRIRAGDEETPYWFPSQTSSGAIREDRLVLPIPPGVRWDQVMPIILPGQERTESKAKALPGPRAGKQKIDQPRASRYQIKRSLLHFAIPKPARATKEKQPREKRKAVKNDPKLVAAARELRDRWLEQVNAGEYRIESSGKYEVRRAIEQHAETDQTMRLPGEDQRLLTAA